MDKAEELIVAKLVLPILKDLILPKLQSVIKKFSIKNIDENLIENNFKEYLSQRYEKYLVIDTLVFPNKQTLFKVLYEPLTIVAKTDARREIEIEINDYPEDFLPKYCRAIIEDTAGMGKSTITKKLFLSIIEQNAGIPILIELRQVNKNNDFLKELQNQISSNSKMISLDLIIKLLNEGQFIFLFDGFDEISKVDKEFVIKDLHRFIEKGNNNNFLITSRQEDSLVSFGDFQKFSIKPLIEKKAHSLIKRYDSYSFKPISKELISQLKKNNDEALKEFLSNPFLVSLLYKTFEYKKDIPIKKCQFYRQIYDALFEAHDLSKEGYLKRDKYSNLHLDDFERVLRYIGYLTSIENKVEYDKNYIINIIDKVKKHLPDLSFKSSDYLKDLLETVPLFKRDGNLIKWGHKSLQDYFSAKFIWIDAKSNQRIILKKIYDDNDNRRFYNVLDLFFELDTITFENTILLWLLEDFQNYCNSHYKHFPSISQTLKQRLENSFHNDAVIVVTKKEEFEELTSDTYEDFRDKISYYDKKVFEINHKFQQTTFNYFNNSKVAVLTYINFRSNIETMLKLISQRIPELTSFKGHKEHLKDLISLQEDHIYKVNDEKDNILNQKNLFGQTNDLISSNYTLNYDISLDRLKKLKEINYQKLGNELTDW
ncbi:MAG: NACHT domain-containing protein [Saprospiraceae bacterium]|nr:NACHT domain-containing protein [Saprospiraceae bacterium]MBP6566897.1 NACHT domain-containing protein [Saprospiraceae bacterium]